MLIPQIDDMKVKLSAEVAINAIMDRADHTVAELTTSHPNMVHMLRISDHEYAICIGAELFTMFWDGKRLGLEHDVDASLPNWNNEDDYDDDDDEEADHA